MFSAKERLTIVVLLGASFMLSADFSIFNVALPEASRAVGLGVEHEAWISSAYGLPAAGFTLLFGRLGDLYGRRRIFVAGLLVLIVGSLVGGLASGAAMLLAGRAVQGVAAAMTIPTGLSLLTTTFEEGVRRDRVLGMSGALACGGFAFGALFGGTLVAAFDWRAAFLINVPTAAALVAAGLRLIPESARPAGVRLDVLGALTVSAGLLALTFAFLDASLVAGIVGLALLVLFRTVENRSAQPLVPLNILRRPGVRWGNIAGVVLLAMVSGLVFLTTVWVQQIIGVSALSAGLIMGVPGVAAVVAGVVGGRLVSRFGARIVLAGGMTVTAAATIPLLFLGADRAALLVIVPALFVCFFGHVAAIVAFTVTATSGLPDREQGLAAGLNTMTAQSGTIGIPLLSAIAAAPSTLLHGIHLALAFDVALTLLTVVAVWRALRPTEVLDAAPADPARPLQTV